MVSASQKAGSKTLGLKHEGKFMATGITPTVGPKEIMTLTMSGWWYTYPSEKYESQLG